MNDPNKITNLTFSCFMKDSADLKLRLRYDGIPQSHFLRELVSLYNSRDPLMLQLVEKIKIGRKTMGKKKLNRTRQDLDKSSQILNDLGITKEEKENIFDMIEMDTEEYYE
jgi:hypothetical protein